MAEHARQWLCTNRLRLPLPDWAALLLTRWLDALDRLLGGRVPHETWIRYRRRLERTEAEPDSGEVVLTPIDDAIIAALAEHPWRDLPQLRSAQRLWRHGLRGGLIWRERGEPLCLQWLFTPEDNPRLRRLPEWAGMYPPLPPGCGQVENLLVLPKGLRRPGSAATVFAYAVYARARALGLEQLVTHVHEHNTPAHRWAMRTGWSAYGTIRRYRFDLPLLRGCCVYVHSSLPDRHGPAAATMAPSAQPISH